MAEPTSGLSVAWLLDHAWTGLVAVLALMWRQQRKDREDADAKSDTHGKMITDVHARISVVESRVGSISKRQEEDRRDISKRQDEAREDHRIALGEFGKQLTEVRNEVRDELHLIRTDLGLALTDFRKENAKFMAAALRHPKD
jgi:hypothetical protein